MTTTNGRKLIVNLYAGPGAGKSTMAARLFVALKDQGAKVELATEYAKDLAYAGLLDGTIPQVQMLQNQTMRILRPLLGEKAADIVVTDSPLLLVSAYGKEQPDHPLVRQIAIKQDAMLRQQIGCLDVFLRRVKPYAAYGRTQTEAEAKALDNEIRGIYKDATGRKFDLTVKGDQAGATAVLEQITEIMTHDD